MTELQLALEKYQETLRNPDGDQGKHLANVQARLEDINSQMPATIEFLEARGLSSVRELDELGKVDLVIHLRNTLAFFSENPDSDLPS